MTRGLTVLPLVVFLTISPWPVFAQDQYACHPVRPGDTAAGFALRLTGRAENVQQRWFRVVDTDALRVVPKSEYGYLLPGWEVCVARTSAGAVAVPFGSRAKRTSPFGSVLQWAQPCLVLLTAVLAWLVAMRHIDERHTILKTMTRFGERFVVEFEEPLFVEPAARRIESGNGDRPVRSRLRFAPHRQRLDILLAPHAGRTYPNLSDHRRNLEYDIDRVLDLLGDTRFSAGPLHAEGRWVVVSFHFKTGHGSLGLGDYGPLRM